MNMQEIRKITQEKHVAPGHLRKADLIRSIQRREGNFDCFKSAMEGICSQLDCIWRKDCLGRKE